MQELIPNADLRAEIGRLQILHGEVLERSRDTQQVVERLPRQPVCWRAHPSGGQRLPDRLALFTTQTLVGR